MKTPILVAALAIGIAVGVPLAMAQPTPVAIPPESTQAATGMTEVDVRALLATKGFT